MLILFKILVIVYYLSINVYTFFLLRTQKKAEEEGDCQKVRDGNLFLGAILGGALGIYVGAFVLKYRTSSLLLMVFAPVLIVFHVFLLVVGFIHDFWVFSGTFYQSFYLNLLK